MAPFMKSAESSETMVASGDRPSTQGSWSRINFIQKKSPAAASDDNKASSNASEDSDRKHLPPTPQPNRRRTICIRVCIIAAIAFAIFAIIFIPIFLLVIIPRIIQDSFANQNLGASSMTFTEISLHNITQEGVVFSFAARVDNVNVPLNIPFDMKRDSDWSVDVLYNDPVIDSNGDQSWKPLMSSLQVPADLSVRNGRANLGAQKFQLKVPNNGSALAAFGEGLSQVFAANDANIVPKMKVGITAAFKLGLLDIRTLPLERVINVGELLLASGFLSPTPTSGSSSSSTEAAVSVSPLPISLLSNGAIASGLRLGIPPPGSPVGIHLRNVVFDLVLDQNTLAKCFIPRLDVTAGDLDMTIPLNITVNTLGSINALFAQVNIFSGQKNIGMKSVSALNENGQRVAWLDRGLERVHFKVPLDRLRSAVSAVLTKWILDLLSASSRRG